MRPIQEVAVSRKVVYLILVLTLMQLAVSLLTYGQTLYFDEATWHYIGRNWFRHGMVPYKGGYDNKSPLIFIIYGLSDMFFGVNYWFPRVLGTLVQSAGIWFLYRIADYLAGRRTGILVVLVYGLSVLWTTTKGKYVSLTETYEVSALLVCACLWLTAKDRRALLVSGLFAALALAFRLTAIAGVSSIFIFAFLRRRDEWCWLMLGGIAGGAALTGAIWLAGISPAEVWHYSFLDNLTPGNLFEKSLGEKITGLINGFIFSRLVIFYPLVAGYLILRRRLDWIVCWWLAGCCCIYRIGLFDPAHFKDLLPPLSLASGLFAGQAIEKYGLPFGFCLAMIALCFFPGLREQVETIRQLFTRPGVVDAAALCDPPYSPLDNISQKRLGCWIRDHTHETDRLLIPFFNPTVQVYSERLSPTIYFSLNEDPKARERFCQEVRARRPEMVIIPLGEEFRKFVSSGMRSWIQQMLDTGYRGDGCMYGYAIYRKVKRDQHE
jgi:hypothetical protein